MFIAWEKKNMANHETRTYYVSIQGNAPELAPLFAQLLEGHLVKFTNKGAGVFKIEADASGIDQIRADARSKLPRAYAAWH